MTFTADDLRLFQAFDRAERRSSFTAAEQCKESPPQLRVVTSPGKRKALLAGRRGGKTRGPLASKLLEDARRPPFAPQLFVAMTRRQAREIIWDDLLLINHEHELGGVANMSELTLTFPEFPGSRIMLTGANNERETAKIRGKKFKRVVADEMQGIPDRVAKPLVLDIIGPALVDYQGELWLAGTPNPVDVGFWYDITAGKLAHLWEQHRWSLLDNPYLHRLAGKTGQQILADVRAEHGWTEDDPTYVREYLGQWTRDHDALVFRWDAGRNGFEALPDGKGWRYVIGVDLGFEDADAIAVLGWTPESPDVYLVEEHVEAKAGITELGEKVAELRQRYQPVATWVDPGGLGRKIIEELRRRWHVPCEAAEKVRKFEHIELLNDALRTGRFHAPVASRFAEDALRVQWDMGARARGQLKVSEGYHSDITDAVLYAYRACRGYLYQAPPPPPPPEPDQLLANRLQQVERRSSSEWWESDAGAMGYEDGYED